MNAIHCVWCDTPFIPKNKNHKFCSYTCGYCFRAGGVPYKNRGWYWSDEEQRIVKPDQERKPIEKPTPKERTKKEIIGRPPKAGFIYLMRSENGLYKIGRAKDIQGRLGGLNREIPIKVEVIHYFYVLDCISEEKRLHTKYKDNRIKFEWFSLAEYQVREILEISGDGVKNG